MARYLPCKYAKIQTWKVVASTVRKVPECVGDWERSATIDHNTPEVVICNTVPPVLPYGDDCQRLARLPRHPSMGRDMWPLLELDSHMFGKHFVGTKRELLRSIFDIVVFEG